MQGNLQDCAHFIMLCRSLPLEEADEIMFDAIFLSPLDLPALDLFITQI